jgi:hypothetical protein
VRFNISPPGNRSGHLIAFLIIYNKDFALGRIGGFAQAAG